MDFAHAPSKVKASLQAVRDKHPEKKLVACLELHTYSSLNKDFLPQYEGSLHPADVAMVYYDPHTLKMKRLPDLDPAYVRSCFGKMDLEIIHDPETMQRRVEEETREEAVLLLMSSGTFGGMDIKKATTK